MPNLKLMPKQLLRQMLMPGMVDTMDTEDTEDTMDGADTTDTPTDMDTTEENAPLMPNPKLMPRLPLRLMLMPLPGIMVATTDTPTDTDTTVWDTVHTMVDTTDILGDTDTVTTDKGLLQIWTITLWSLLVLIYQCQSLTILSKLANFYPPFELSTKQTTTALKNTEKPVFPKYILLQTSPFG